MKSIKNFKYLRVVNNMSFKDKRGYFKELLIEKKIKKKFPFLVMSYSKKNVIRGLHLQFNNSQGKYVSVIKGKIFDVCVDLRKDSKTFGKYFSVIISEKNSKSIFVPPGFAHGFCALDKENYVIYSCTKYRDAKSEVAINFNDRKLKIKWPVKKAIVSKKDKSAISFNEYLNSLDIFLIDFVNLPICLMNAGKSLGPITTITTMLTNNNSPQPKLNIGIIYLRL